MDRIKLLKIASELEVKIKQNAWGKIYSHWVDNWEDYEGVKTDSMYQLSKLSDIAESRLSAYKNGKGLPSLVHITRLVIALDIDVNYVLEI